MACHPRGELLGSHQGGGAGRRDPDGLVTPRLGRHDARRAPGPALDPGLARPPTTAVKTQNTPIMPAKRHRPGVTESRSDAVEPVGALSGGAGHHGADLHRSATTGRGRPRPRGDRFEDDGTGRRRAPARTPRPRCRCTAAAPIHVVVVPSGDEQSHPQRPRPRAHRHRDGGHREDGAEVLGAGLARREAAGSTPAPAPRVVRMPGSGGERWCRRAPPEQAPPAGSGWPR